MATTANARYSFEITSSEALAAHPKSGLAKVIVSGVCTNADGISFDFVATNNLQPSICDTYLKYAVTLPTEI